ncbi:hypothetical protein [Mameliella alba]|uniref:hypothetical protein n=1 Tax=Mameliella alba TaxID=561184 RepID=UPI00142FFB7F|nr:hypothetical protein [Mameliella alba]
MTNGLPTSAAVEKRLREEAKAFDRPADRISTIDRLVAACDALEDGSAAAAFHHSTSARRRHTPEKINPTNIDTYVRFMGWTGPTRTFISNKKNGLRDYVSAREDERQLGDRKISVKPETQEESYLDRIPDVEVRQFVRFEIERRRVSERELNLVKNGLKRIPHVSLSDLFELMPRVDHTPLSNELYSHDFGTSEVSRIRDFLSRIEDVENLRHLGLKVERGDILALTGALVISKEEIEALHTLIGRRK